MGESLTDLVREAARRLHPGKIVLGTTTSAVDTASVLDNATLLNSDANTNQYNGVIVRIDEYVAGPGPEVGEAQRVIVGGYAGATGDLTTNAYSQIVRTGTDFSLHRGIRPQDWEDYANRVLTQAHHKAFHPLSVLPDWDWEDGTLTNNWTLSSVASETMAQHSTAADLLYGRYGAKLDSVDAANAYIKNKVTVRCHEGEQWEVWVPLLIDRTDKGTAKLIAYDVTNSEEIETATTDHLGSTLLGFRFTIPSGCKELEIHLQTVTAAMIIYWGPVGLLPLSRVRVDLPSWLKTESQLRGLGLLPSGPSTAGDNEDLAYRALETRIRPVRCNPAIYPLHANPRRIEFDYPGGGPMFLNAWRPFAELSNPAGAAAHGTTEMDKETCLTGMLAAGHEALAERLSNSDGSRAQWHYARSVVMDNAYREMLEEQDYAIPETEVEVPVRTPVRLR